MSWVEDQIVEIESSPTLIHLGLALALTHVLTHYAWAGGEMPLRYLLASTSNTDPVCWPFLPFCAKLKIFSEAGMMWFGRGYAVLGLAAAGLFATRRAAVGWFALAALTLLKLLIFWQDYRFASEFHLLLFAASIFYLALPGKRWALGWLIAGAYVSAGLHHLRPDWFTGAGAPSFVFTAGVPRWFRTHDLWPLAAVLVSWLTTVGALGLTVPAPKPRAAALAALVVLQIAAASFTGWVTAAMMILLLAPFIYEVATTPQAPLGALAPVALGALALVALLQIPSLIDPNKENWRWGAVAMFDSNRSCRSVVMARFHARAVDLSRPNFEKPHWMDCDVYTALDQIRHLCPQLKTESDFEALTWQLQQRLSPARPAELIAAADDVCAPGFAPSTATAHGGRW